jgi:hypothetical protein
LSLVGLVLEFLELLQTVSKIYDLLCKPALTLFLSFITFCNVVELFLGAVDLIFLVASATLHFCLPQHFTMYLRAVLAGIDCYVSRYLLSKDISPLKMLILIRFLLVCTAPNFAATP